MSVHDQNVGYLPTCDKNDPKYPISEERDNRIRPYHHHHHQRELSSNSSFTLPSITHDQVYAQQSHTIPQDQRPVSESRQNSSSPAINQEYNRSNPQQVPLTQSAPRQRTAIACRYCRRRKVSVSYCRRYSYFLFYMCFSPPKSFVHQNYRSITSTFLLYVFFFG